ncbi:hypothetical protein [Teredinibacter franksiae]|uniref:hypothetical protein n=1 Tax=Teredinibacter franksiae TaxID=2761453 RepID=UPI00162A9219|nr:hypothetical protein [Teredinibacter franksiae]
MFKKKDPNLERLKNLLSKIEDAESPVGWEKVASPSVGGLTDLGFSKQGPYLLVISSQGRGLFNCDTGERVSRDYEEYGDWFNDRSLICKGIGPVESELIQTCGIHGGGLPHSGVSGESIEVHAPNWPKYDLYFCSEYKSALIEGHASFCKKIESEHLRAYGFSWCGNYLVSAIGSDFNLWKKL